MKKLLLMMLVLCTGVSTASADDYLKGTWKVANNEWVGDETTKFTYAYDGAPGTLVLSLAAETTYEFGFQNGNDWKGLPQAGTMTSSDCIGWWFNGNSNAKITTTIAGDYTFIVNWVTSDNTNYYPSIGVIYPNPVKRQYTIHFSKGNSWSQVNAHRWITLSGNTTNLTTWPGELLAENANNSGYYDITFSDACNYVNYVLFSDNGNETNRSGNVAVDFSYPETWVTNNESITPNAPDVWVGHTRSVTAGNFGTICLPFAATVTGATVFKITSKVLDESSNLKGINLESVDALEAGKAYIFKATGSTLTATYSGSYTAATDANGMLGNLSSTPLTVPADADNYVVSGNQIHKVVSGGDGVTVGQNKAYITLTNIEETNARAANFIGFADDDVTSIESVETVKAQDIVYDLQGQRVKDAKNGLFIVNGKKVLK